MTHAAGVFVIVSCEHGGNRVPADLSPLFRRMRRALKTHRGYDPGALLVARMLARSLDAPLVASTVSRLVIDLNRSPGNGALWSEATRALAPDARDRILRRHYLPYRNRVEDLVAAACEARRKVIHLSSHSFTPVLHGKIRRADVGLLYDPARPGEATLCAALKSALRARAPSLRVRRNYPYKGDSDGLTSWLRTRYTPAQYVGIELELNQAVVARDPREWRWLREALLAAISSAVGRAMAASPALCACGS